MDITECGVRTVLSRIFPANNWHGVGSGVDHFEADSVTLAEGRHRDVVRLIVQLAVDDETCRDRGR